MIERRSLPQGVAFQRRDRKQVHRELTQGKDKPTIEEAPNPKAQVLMTRNCRDCSFS